MPPLKRSFAWELVQRTQLHNPGAQFLQSVNVLLGFFDMLVSGYSVYQSILCCCGYWCKLNHLWQIQLCEWAHRDIGRNRHGVQGVGSRIWHWELGSGSCSWMHFNLHLRPCRCCCRSPALCFSTQPESLKTLIPTWTWCSTWPRCSLAQSWHLSCCYHQG